MRSDLRKILPSEPELRGVQMIGGDMFQWSDFTALTALEDDDPDGFDPKESDDHGPEVPEVPPPALLWEQLLGGVARVATGHVLLVGAQAARCLSLFSEATEVDVLLRARSDAAAATAAHPNVRVWCGSLVRFVPEQAYDLVIALDPFWSYYSPDEGMRSEQETIAGLRELAGGGTAIFRVTNRIGVDKMLTDHTPADRWEMPQGGYTLAEVRGLGDVRIGCVAGNTPSLYVSEQASADPALHGALGAYAAGVLAADQLPSSSIRDPWAVVPDLVSAGDWARMSPTWLVVDGKAKLPGFVSTTDDRLAPAWRRWVLAGNDTSLRIVGAQGGDIRLGALRRLSASSEQIAAGELPAEALWRRVAATGEFELLREVVSAWSRWLETVPLEQAFFASPENLVTGADGEPRLLDSTWSWSAGSLDEAKVVCLRRFAQRLLDSGARHPWPSVTSLNAVVESLALMAGVDWQDDELLASAVTTTARIDLLSTLGHDNDLGNRVERELAVGMQHRFSLASKWSRQEGQRVLNKLASEATQREEQLAWCAATIRRQDGNLQGVRRQLESIEKSIPYKMARSLTWPGRAVIQAVKGVVKRSLPPSTWMKIQRLIKRQLR